jgi:hypothetical protein
MSSVKVASLTRIRLPTEIRFLQRYAHHLARVDDTGLDQICKSRAGPLAEQGFELAEIPAHGWTGV